MVGLDPCYCAPSWQCFLEKAIAQYRRTEVYLKQTKDYPDQIPTDMLTVD